MIFVSGLHHQPFSLILFNIWNFSWSVVFHLFVVIQQQHNLTYLDSASVLQRKKIICRFLNKD
uniref:Uncharacterized protein n=1 Tax=Rhizophora mucronata TaxID=61149 RepID=A0A2P2L121_RHIMU